MEIKKGYLVYNITQKDEDIFKSQIKAFLDSFKENKVNLITVDNLHAFETIKNDTEVSFVLFWDKDIALAYQLMNLDIKVFNNVDALRLCDDKAYTYTQLIKNKVSTPKTLILPLTFFKDITTYIEDIKSQMRIMNLNYPLIVKERRSSLGMGVFLIRNDEELLKILKSKWSRELIIQEYISYEVGIDYRVYLINHRPKAVVTRKNPNDFRSNVELGGKMSVIKTPDEQLLLNAIRASLAVKLDFGAVDLVKDKNNNYYVLEVNSNARTATLDRITKTPVTTSVCKYILSNI